MYLESSPGAEIIDFKKIISKIKMEFEDYYDIVFNDSKLDFNDILDKAMLKIQKSLFLNDGELINERSTQAILDNLYEKRRLKRIRLVKRITDASNIILDDANKILSDIYIRDREKFFELYPINNKGDVRQELILLLNEEVLNWKNDKYSYFKDFKYLRDCVISIVVCTNYIIEDIVVYSLSEVLSTLKDSKEIDTVPNILIKTPRAFGRQKIKVNGGENIIDTYETKESLTSYNYPTKVELEKSLKLSNAGDLIKSAFIDTFYSKLSEVEFDALRYIIYIGTDSIINNKIINFKLIDLVNYLFKSNNSFYYNRAIEALIKLKNITVEKSYGKEFAFNLSILNDILFIRDEDTGEVSVQTDLGTNLKTQILNDAATRLDRNIRNLLDDDFAKLLSTHIQALRLITYYRHGNNGIFEDKPVVLDLDWFRSIIITSLRQKALIKKITAALDEFKSKNILISNYELRGTQFVVTLKNMSKTEYSKLNYSSNAAQNFLKSIDGYM